MNPEGLPIFDDQNSQSVDTRVTLNNGYEDTSFTVICKQILPAKT